MRKQLLNKNSKILIIGFGSIGQRHHKNLVALGYRNVYAYDTDSEKIKNQKSKIKNLEQKILKRFDVVFVCSPNHLHVKHALMAAKAGCHLFIEKPLSHNLKGVGALEKLARSKRLVNMVACNMRFHPALKFIKDYLAERRLGKIYSISHESGYYLPYWRPNQDYRKNYAAKQKTGGGVILDDIHEFDLLFWLNDFTDVKKRVQIFDRVSDLQIQTEDVSLTCYQFRNKVFGLVKSDYLQKSYSRSVKIVGEKGNIEWNYTDNKVILKTEKSEKKLFAEKFIVNDMYVDELKYFLDCVVKRQKTFNDISRANIVLSHAIKE